MILPDGGIDFKLWKTVVLTKIMDEADKVEPFLVRVLFTNPLCSLERVHNIRQVQVGITFINLSDYVCEIMFELFYLPTR